MRLRYANSAYPKEGINRLTIAESGVIGASIR
jgi:hypothetical protein